jgi:DNA-binding XRE family transcriptional regulator
MASLRDDGLSFAEIGRRLGVCRQAVYATLLKAEGRKVRPITCRECGAVIVAHPGGNWPPLPALCLDCLGKHADAPLADRLRAFRLAAGLTQGQLDERAGLPRGTINRYERGKGRPSWEDIVVLARVLGAGLLTLGLRLPEGPGHGQNSR